MEQWKRQRLYKKGTEPIVPTPEEIYNMIKSIKDEPFRCLCAILYLSGCRISELVRYEKLQFQKQEYTDDKGKTKHRVLWKTKTIIESHPSICKKQLQFVMDEYISVLLISTRNLKNRERHTKDVPINLSKKENIEFVDIINPYITKLGPGDELFPFNRPQAEYMSKKWLPFNLHFLRDLRATNLSKIDDLNTSELQKVFGWTDGRPAAKYIMLKWRDLVKKM